MVTADMKLAAVERRAALRWKSVNDGAAKASMIATRDTVTSSSTSVKPRGARAGGRTRRVVRGCGRKEGMSGPAELGVGAGAAAHRTHAVDRQGADLRVAAAELR